MPIESTSSIDRSARTDIAMIAGVEGTCLTSAESVVDWDMAKTLEQLDGDATLLREVIEIFLNEAPKHLSTLRLAVNQGISATVESAAHSLKGELGYLGQAELSKKALEIEEVGRSHNIERAASLFPQFEAEITNLCIVIRATSAIAVSPNLT